MADNAGAAAAQESEIVDGIHPEDDGIDQGLRDAFDDVDPGDREPEARAAAPADDKPSGQQPAAGEQQTAADAADTEPPANWSATDQQTFRELPEPARKMLLTRSKAMEAAHTQRSQEVAPLRQALQRWDPFLRQLGGDPLTTIDTAMGIVHTLRSGTPQQRAGLLNQLAHDFGVQVNGNGNGGPQQRTPENDPLGVGAQIDAALAPVMQRIDGLAQQGQTAQQQQQQFRQQQQQQHRDQLRQTVDAFADAKDANGAPLHPHFDEVAATMAAAVQARLASGQPVDLAELYDAACWGTPSVREKLLASRDAGNSQQRSQQEQARNQQTARAAGSLTGRGRNSEVEEQPDDLDEALRQNMRLMGA